jgi:DNA-binding winged helix-turn-helix (wHTH) protein
LAASSNSRGVAIFDGFQLDLHTGELRRNGTRVKLQPQPAKVLVLLTSRAGEIISRAELAERVWGSETFVDFEHGLNFAVRQIRTALDDNAEEPRFLETVPKLGYRFIAPVQGLPAEPATPVLSRKPEIRHWWPLAAALSALLIGALA